MLVSQLQDDILRHFTITVLKNRLHDASDLSSLGEHIDLVLAKLRRLALLLFIVLLELHQASLRERVVGE